MKIKKAEPVNSSYVTPEEMFSERRTLRRPEAVAGSLWGHQVDMLRAFVDKKDKPDLALELPTGTGKTLIGLLIAEWTRLQKKERVVYACPTQQLAHQTHVAAYNEGIDTSLLIGSHKSWDLNSKLNYEIAEKIAITTYNTIFNSSPHLLQPEMILFDDAHAGDQYIGEAYSVALNRQDDFDAYDKVLKAVAPALDDLFLKRLRSETSDMGNPREIRMILPLRQPNLVESLYEALESLEGQYKHRYSMIMTGLPSCLVYVAHSRILVRPYLPPTHQNTLFSSARQRIYLSATLGEGGELERAFGRTGIERLHRPETSAELSWGRRLFVFPDLVSDADPGELSREVVEEAGKALVLAPQKSVAEKNAKALAREGWEVLGIDDVKESLDRFVNLEHGVCALASRYDGLDLPGQACRLVVMDGVPNRDNLQERFLQSNVRAEAALDSRVRTRFVQGTGRCTRGPEDISIVLVRGDLLNYILRPENLLSFATELQAEIRFGRKNFENGAREDVLDLVRVFLRQEEDEIWRNEVEKEAFPSFRDEAKRESRRSPTAKYLSDCAEEEVEAWIAATMGDWKRASQHAHEVAHLVQSGGSSTKGYRAFWMYLEAAWRDQMAEDSNDDADRVAAQKLVREAEETAGAGTWVRQMAPFSKMERSSHLSALDRIAVNAVTTMLHSPSKENRFRQRIENMAAILGEENTNPNQYEEELRELGEFLGSQSSRPDKSSDQERQGRCDAAWCWDNELWVTLEAKNGQKATGSISLDNIRQINQHLKLLKKDKKSDEIPQDSISVIISPKSTVENDAITIAEPYTYYIGLNNIKNIVSDVKSAWNQILTNIKNINNEKDSKIRITEVLDSYGLLPSIIRERLTESPVASRTTLE